MKSVTALAILVLTGCASESASAGPSWTGGSPFSDGAVTPPGEILRDGERLAANRAYVRVEGRVTKVCQGAGCWVEISDGASVIIARSLDHDVLFPKDCAGRKVLVYGPVRFKPPLSGGDDCPKPEILVEVMGARLY